MSNSTVNDTSTGTTQQQLPVATPDAPDSWRGMTLEELERQADDPEAIFRRFCEDCAGAAPDEHLLSLFREAQADYERSVQG